EGALINKVDPRGPAAKAGIQSGDVILEMDGQPVQDPQAMRFRLATLTIGTPVTLKVWRKGKAFETKMITEAPPETPPRDRTTITGANPLLGATVVNISPAVIEDIGSLPADSGVAVESAEKN